MVGNRSSQPEFTLLGLSDLTDDQIPVFLLILLVYVTTLAGNLLIISLVVTDSHLQTPMYFFLANLSVLDIAIPTVCASHLSFDFFTGNTEISISSCLAQVFFFLWFAYAEAFLLSVMSYDRYVAICLPLHYTTRISICLCVKLASSTWITGSLIALTLTLCTLRLVFCGSTPIPGLFCELYQLIQLSCSDNSLNDIILSLLSLGVSIILLSISFLSYFCIFKTILKIKLKDGKSKAFSTCGSHLLVVFIFYGAGVFNYFNPKAKEFSTGKFMSLVYTLFTPFLNPLIYSLRNAELKGALLRALAGVGYCKTNSITP